jgi:hypothetical protein
LRVVGPRGTDALMSGRRQAYADDIRFRMADERVSAPLASRSPCRKYDGDCVVYDQGGVKVIALGRSW